MCLVCDAQVDEAAADAAALLADATAPCGAPVLLRTVANHNDDESVEVSMSPVLHQPVPRGRKKQCLARTKPCI